MFSNFLLKSAKQILHNGRGFCSTAEITVTEKLPELKMRAWQVHSYGEELKLGTTRIPYIEADQVLVKVEAASVNPIDTLMLRGYGKTIFQLLRGNEIEFPLILGRDFCGKIVRKGANVTSYNVGDIVYGFNNIVKQGSFAEYAIAEESFVNLKPKHLTSVEAASIVYAGMTSWSALYITGNLFFTGASGVRVLILGASGGVGTAATQLLKSQGAFVTATCATDAVPLVKTLNADLVFDYKDPKYLDYVANSGKYDIILDCAKFGSDQIPKNWKYSSYIALNSPLMVNTDKHGLLPGLITSGGDLLFSNLKNLLDGKIIKWGFFVPSETGFKFIHNLIKQGKISPVIHKEFKFANLPEAFEEVSKGHLRGKVVISFE